MTAGLRIISLVPSVTELLVDLGLAPWIVGRTGYCIHPAPVVGRIPKVGGTKTVNLEKIRRLAPTHVVVNVDENTREMVGQLQTLDLQVLVTHPKGPDDNLQLFEQMADAFDVVPAVAPRALHLKRELNAQLALMDPFAGREPVMYLIWRDPWMTVARDTYISRMLGLIGWQTWPDVDGGDHGAARYPQLELSDPGLQQVRKVLLSSEPFSFSARDEVEIRTALPQASVMRVDGEMLSWYGSRAIAGLAYLRTLAQSPV